LFSAASVAFNIAHAPDRPVAQLVFAMAPIALVLTTHLLMQQASWRYQAPPMAGYQADSGRPQPDTGVAMGGHGPAMPDPLAEAARREPDPQTQARRVYRQHQAAGPACPVPPWLGR
jgi:hypothetical protein